ncbi:DUF4232 domain-containing protein [Streptomyces sp. NPDC059766]|uniref:DUF4232 domain-containing protein n=1 Tax=Streptomyces sp. NPDC059766 TaxID=3346940 RepID=UPI003652CB29
MSQSKSLSTALLCAFALLGPATACSAADGAPAASRPAADSSGTAPGTTSTAAGTATRTATGTAGAAPGATGGHTSGAAAGTRCHTSQLRASVGRNNPGAGQENFPLVLTNSSPRTCTLYGFPGAAFLDGAGRQVGPDPKRTSGQAPTAVKLAPGQSAWAGLTFSNPEISEASTAIPDWLLITPPDEQDPLKVHWTAGKVPVAGNASSVFLTVFSAGRGA